MNKKEKQSLINNLNRIRNIINMPDDELRQCYKWLEEFDEISYATKCGIIHAEIDHLIEKCKRGGIG